MEFNIYQEAAMTFRKDSADQYYALLGLSGEVGELHSHVAKALRDNTDVDADYIKKELGDILWFVAAIADDIGVSLNKVAEGNIKKLLGRHQRGTIGGSGDDR